MDDATLTLIAVPQALAEAARAAAAQWDPAGADSMFRQPTLYPTGDPSDLYVFSYGWIADEYGAAISDASAAFPGAWIVPADTFDGALTQAGLARVIVDMPPGANGSPAA